MTQQGLVSVSKSFQHSLDFEEAKDRANEAFAMYSEKAMEAAAGLSPTFRWRSSGNVADLTMTVNRRVLAGTVKLTGSTAPGVAKDGVLEIAFGVPADIQPFVSMYVSLASKEIEKWLTM